MIWLQNTTPLRRLMMLGHLAGGIKTDEVTTFGNPITFQTDLARPLKSLEIPFSPRQTGSGDPSPSNIRPIVPWEGLSVKHGGKNLLKISAETFIIKTSSALTIEYTETGAIFTLRESESYAFAIYKVLKITSGLVGAKFCKNTGFSSDAVITCDEQGDNRATLVNNTVQESDVGKILAFRCYITQAAHAGRRVVENAQIEVGTTATAYEPYVPITETDISFPSPVYGGTLDVVSGVLTVEWVSLTKTWGDFSNKTSLGDNTRGTLNISAYPSKPSSEAVDAKCNIAPRGTGWSTDSVHFYTNEGSCIVFLPNDTDASTEIQVVYPLATPQEIQLTPAQITALVGNNTLWSDADRGMTAVYLKKR